MDKDFEDLVKDKQYLYKMNTLYKWGVITYNELQEGYNKIRVKHGFKEISGIQISFKVMDTL